VISANPANNMMPMPGPNMPLTPPNGTNIPGGANNSLFLPPMAQQLPAEGGPMSAGGQGLEFNGQK
jgi:hypothetical protein